MNVYLKEIELCWTRFSSWDKY